MRSAECGVKTSGMFARDQLRLARLAWRKGGQVVDELIYASATTIAQAVREKKVSAKEVVEAHLQRIEAVNPALNAVVYTVSERALDEALAADQALARGEAKGPLHGGPMTIKDSLDTAGVVSTSGTKGRA